MVKWYLLAGNEPEELKKIFSNFYLRNNSPCKLALWRWKKTCWICAPEGFQQALLSTFDKYNIIEFSSAPSRTDIEFLCGDKLAFSETSELHPTSKKS